MNTGIQTNKVCITYDSRKEAKYYDVSFLHLPRHLRGSKTTNLFELARKLNDLTSGDESLPFKFISKWTLPIKMSLALVVCLLSEQDSSNNQAPTDLICPNESWSELINHEEHGEKCWTTLYPGGLESFFCFFPPFQGLIWSVEVF